VCNSVHLFFVTGLSWEKEGGWGGGGGGGGGWRGKKEMSRVIRPLLEYSNEKGKKGD